MATFSELKANALDRAGLPASDGMAQDSTLGKAVNAAIQRIGGRRSWPWLYDEVTAATTAGAPDLPLPAVSRVHHAAIGGDVLDRRQRSDLFRYSDLPAGTPAVYALSGPSTLVLAPVPDQAYTVQLGVTLVEPALVNGTDTPLLPAQFHDLIALEAARYIVARKKDTEMVRILADEAKDLWAALDRAALLAVGTFPARTRQDWGI